MIYRTDTSSQRRRKRRIVIYGHSLRSAKTDQRKLLSLVSATVNSRITVAGSAATRLKLYFVRESYKVSLYGYDLAIKKWDHITFPIKEVKSVTKRKYQSSSEEAVMANGQKCISVDCFQYFSLVVFFSLAIFFILCILHFLYFSVFSRFPFFLKLKTTEMFYICIGSEQQT